MNSTISEWLQAPEISPILLALNLTRLTPIPDCEAAGSFAADFRRLLLNDTTTLPLTSLTIFLHSYPDISLTMLHLVSLGNGSPGSPIQYGFTITDHASGNYTMLRLPTTPTDFLPLSISNARTNFVTTSTGQVIRIYPVLV